jgi:NAD(P)-dependent dehydrogenase (short-subunit alcohol dehydrogenase family)
MRAMRFQDKVAFITGAGAGLGREFARALAAEGAAIAAVDIDAAAAEATAKELSTLGPRAIALDCDVSDRAQVEQAAARAVDGLGGIDILINNAGLHVMRYNQPFSRMPEADLRRLLDVNVVGVVNGSVACREALRARRGTIVNIASMAGYLNNTPYGVSKLAVRGLTVALAREFAPDEIRVNAIAPGMVDTDAVKEGMPEAMKRHVIEDLQVIHRPGTTRDIVSAMLFLCSDDSSFVTGETLKVSGGAPLFI